MTKPSSRIPKIALFVVGILVVLVVGLIAIWSMPSVMYGSSHGLGQMVVTGYYLGVAIFSMLLAFGALLTFFLSRRRRQRGDYHGSEWGRPSPWCFWLPTTFRLLFCATGLSLIVGFWGPSVVSRLVSKTKYRELEHERKLFVEFALRPEPAPWAVQALMDTIWKEDFDAMNRYLKYGADPAVGNGSGHTALHIAVLRGNESLTREFLQRGVDVNLRDDRGDTPLHEACRKRDLAIVQLLIDSGADVNAICEFGSPIDVARGNGNQAAIEVITKAGGRSTR